MNFDTMIFELQSPTVFGEKHILGTIFIFVIIAILLIMLLKVFRNVNHRKVLKITALFLIFLELAKYTEFYIMHGTFPAMYIPMQLCSFSLYLMPLVAFTKPEISKKFMPIAYSIGLLAGIIVLFYPATVLGGEYNWFPLKDNIVPIISFFYHGTMIFFSLYLVLSKLYRPSFEEYPKVFISLILFAGLASITNLIFNTDMMFLNTASGSPLQFILADYGRLPYLLTMVILAGILLTLPVIPFGVGRIILRIKRTFTED